MRLKQLLWLLIPVFNTGYQVFIKLAADDMKNMDFGLKWIVTAAQSPWIWAALVSEIASFILWIQVLSIYNLSKAFPLSAISYITILCTGWFVFNEEILYLQLVGSILILAGVWLIATASTEENHNEVAQ